MKSFISSFFLRRSAGPSFRNMDTSNWMTLGAGSGYVGTDAGVYVDEQTALAITAVYRAVALISDAVSMLPVAVMRKDGDRRTVEEDHPIGKLLNRAPNKLMSSVNLRTATQAHTLQYGSGYQEIQRDQNGKPVALWPLLPDRTSVYLASTSEDEAAVKYQTTVGGKAVLLEPEDVIHILGLSYDGLRGYSPLGLYREGLGLTKALEKFGSKFFGNDAKSGGFLEYPGKLNDQGRKNLQDSMADQGGITNSHRIKILEEGMKFNATTIAPEDSQFLMTRTFQVEEIGRLYGIPLHMLQSHAKSTSWGSGLAQMSLGFLIYTLAPWLTRWEQELTRKLFSEAEQDAGYYVRHNVNALLRSDPATRASYYTAALNMSTGWMVRDEVRALEDMNPDGIENEIQTQSFGMPTNAPNGEEEEEEEEEEG